MIDIARSKIIIVERDSIKGFGEIHENIPIHYDLLMDYISEVYNDDDRYKEIFKDVNVVDIAYDLVYLGNILIFINTSLYYNNGVLKGERTGELLIPDNLDDEAILNKLYELKEVLNLFDLWFTVIKKVDNSFDCQSLKYDDLDDKLKDILNFEGKRKKVLTK